MLHPQQKKMLHSQQSNPPSAQADCPTFSPGQSRSSVLQAAAMAAKWWEPPRDALDTMVLGAADLDALSGLRHIDFTPFDPTLKVPPLKPLVY